MYSSVQFLTEHGIPVIRITQEPGDLIVTFPGGYHCGCNVGYNVCEAISATNGNGLKFIAVADYCTRQEQNSVKINISEIIRQKQPKLYQIYNLMI